MHFCCLLALRCVLGLPLRVLCNHRYLSTWQPNQCSTVPTVRKSSYLCPPSKGPKDPKIEACQIGPSVSYSCRLCAEAAQAYRQTYRSTTASQPQPYKQTDRPPVHNHGSAASNARVAGNFAVIVCLETKKASAPTPANERSAAFCSQRGETKEDHALCSMHRRRRAMQGELQRRSGASSDPTAPPLQRRRLFCYKAPSDNLLVAVGRWMDKAVPNMPNRYGLLLDVASGAQAAISESPYAIQGLGGCLGFWARKCPDFSSGHFIEDILVCIWHT
jgi:hypothetical protein